MKSNQIIMKNSILSVAAVLLSFVPFSSIKAQSVVAHLNYQEIIQLMPEYKTASAEYELYREALEDQLKEIEAEAMNVNTKYQAESQKAQPSQVRLKSYASQLEMLQQDYQLKQQSIQDSLTFRMNELVAPIKEKIEKVVAQIAKEKGYTHVFDSSVVYMLYSDPAHDLTALVKTRLGIKEKPAVNPGIGGFQKTGAQR
jgi:outer membrane protein